jgi:hypothetical protein
MEFPGILVKERSTVSGANLRRKLLLALILVLGIPSVIVLAGVKPERVNDVLPDEV